VEFYGRAGIPVAFRLDEAGIALLKVGKETPGLLLQLEEELGPRPPAWASARVWLEVRDARATADALASAGIQPLAPAFQVATGWTVEVADPWGNVIGFTDYGKRPELGRPQA
jgi:predicted enzyme related to lactoylglutathione lyase